MALSLSTRLVAVAALVAACGGSKGGSRGGEPTGTAGAGNNDAVVDFSVTHQHISGFGASSAWTLRDSSESFADQLFSPELGIGLSLLRVRIAPSGTTDELRTAQK